MRGGKKGDEHSEEWQELSNVIKYISDKQEKLFGYDGRKEEFVKRSAGRPPKKESPEKTWKCWKKTELGRNYEGKEERQNRGRGERRLLLKVVSLR